MALVFYPWLLLLLAVSALSQTVPQEFTLNIAKGSVSNAPNQAQISFLTDPDHNYVVEYREQLGPDGECSEWRQLPGAPHNAGVVWETNSEPERFYRVLRLNQPQSRLFALLANDTGASRMDEITFDCALAGMAGSSPGFAGLRARLDDTNGSFADLTSTLNADGRFHLSHEQVVALNGGALADGAHTLFLRVVDSLGAGLDEFAVSFVLDTTPPALSLALAAASDSAPVGDQSTVINPVTLIGTTEPELNVALVPGGRTTTADAQGHFAFTNVVINAGAQVYTVSALDPACNLGVGSLLLVQGGPTPSDCVTNTPPDWVVTESGGSPAGRGGVLLDGDCKPMLRSGDSFVVGLQMDFTIPYDPSLLVVTLGEVVLETATNGIRDAFEIALTDSTGNSLVHTIDPGTPGRDAFFNLTESQPALIAPGVISNGMTVRLNLANQFRSTRGKLRFRLVSNHPQTDSWVTIRGIETRAGAPQSPVGSARQPVPAANPITNDFSQLSDVTPGIAMNYRATSFEQRQRALYTSLILSNRGQIEIGGPLVVVVSRISDPSVRVRGADGTTPDGLPYLNFTPQLSANSFTPGAATSERALAFANPNGVPFTYELTVFGQLNRAPQFTSTPPSEAETDVALSYQATATDPDGDSVTFALRAGPSGMTLNPNSGALLWMPSLNDLGQHSILLEASDGRGGKAEQSFTLLVQTNFQNRPPRFITTPVVVARVNGAYAYDADATDPDAADVLTFSLLTAPAGMTNNPASGLLTWQPSANQFGTHEVSLRVSDGRGGRAVQSFAILVGNSQDNHDPLFVTTPRTIHNLNADPNDAIGDVTPRSLSLDLLPGQIVTNTVSLTLSNLDVSAGFADVAFMVDESGSMAGEHEWLSEMIPSLEAALLARGIGPNRYYLGGFGNNPRLFNLGGQMDWQVFGPDQQLLTQNSIGEFEDQPRTFVRFERDGEYTLVLNPNAATPTLDYNVRVLQQNTPSSPLAGFGVVHTGTLAPSETATFNYSAPAGTIVFVDLQDTVNLRRALVNPEGAELAALFATEGSPISLNQSGPYTFSVRNQSTTATNNFRWQLLTVVNALPLGADVSGTLASGASSDQGLETRVFYYDGTAGERLYFQNIAGDSGGQLVLYGPDDTQLFSRTFLQDGEVVLPMTGRHVLAVRGTSASVPVAYHFRVLNLPELRASLTLGTTITNQLAQPGEQHRYAFSGTRGQVIYFDGLSSDHAGIEAVLRSAAGTVVFDDRGSVGRDLTANHGPLFLPEDGAYWVTVDGSGNASGGYAFRMLDLNTNSTAITVPQQITSTTAQGRSTELFRFNGAAGQGLFFERISSGGGLSLTLWDSSGSVVESGGFGSFHATLPNRGQYILAVIGSSSSGPIAFDARLHLPQVVTADLTLNQPATDTISTPGDRHVYEFNASAGQRIMVDDLTPGFPPVGVQLLSPSRQSLFASGSLNVGPVTLTETGTWSLLFESDDSIGTYNFQLLTPNDLALETELEGTIAPRSAKMFRFNGTAGQRVAFDSRTNGQSGDWVLHDPLNNGFAGGDVNTDFAALLPADGEYLLRFQNDSTTEALAYRFLVTATTDAPVALSGFGVPLEGTLAPNATQSFNLTAPAATLAYFDNLIAADQATLRVLLTAPDATTVFSDFSAGDAEFLLTQSGPYTLTVSNRSTSANTPFAVQMLATPAEALTFDAPVSGTLEHNGIGREARWFQFEATAGETVFFLSTVGAAADNWRVYHRGGDQIASAPRNQNLEVPLRASGIYLLALVGGSASASAFEFTASRATNLIRNVNIGDTVAGSLNKPGQDEVFFFNATAGQRLYFDGLNRTNDLRAQVRDPFGGLLFNNVNLDADGSPVTAAHSGVHALTVFGSGAATGGFEFRLLDATAAEALTYDTPITGTLDPGRSTRLFRINAAAVPRVFFDLQAITGGGDFRLYTPENSLRFLSPSGDQEEILTAPGEYLLAVRGSSAGGPATFAFSAHDATDPVVAANFNDTISSAIAAPSDRRVYRFNGMAGQRVFFRTLAPGAPFGLSATLVAPGGEDLFSDRANLDHGPVTLPETAAYHLVVDGSSATTGSFGFQLLDFSSAPLFVSGAPLTGTFGDSNQFVTVRFNAVAGQTLTLQADTFGADATNILAAFTKLTLTQGGNENGYAAMDLALEMPFREGAAVNLVLVTDEGCSCSGYDFVNNVAFTNLLVKMEAAGVTLNVVINGNIRDANNTPAVGIDSDRVTYLPDGAGGFTESNEGITGVGATGSNTKARYIDLAWATGGAAWDLNQLRAGGLVADSFTAAFVQIKAEEIFTQLAALDLIASDATAPFRNLTGPLAEIGTNEIASFDIELAGSELNRSFDLLFVRPRSGAIVGSIPVLLSQPYLYLANAIDPDADPVSYEVLTHPAGATVNPATGRLEWNPPGAGVFPFALLADDGRGGRALQEFIVTVTAGTSNTAPVIVSTPGTNATAGRAYTTTITATDADGDALAFFLNAAPTGLAIDRQSGRILWTPTAGQEGQRFVTVRVLDGRGGQALQNFFIIVAPDTSNAPPVFTSSPLVTARPGLEYRYAATATDADGDTLQFDLPLAPVGMTVDGASGVVVWSPALAQSGIANVILRVRDGHGGTALQLFEINVEGPNAAPVFTSTPHTNAAPNLPYRYEPGAQEADGDLLTFFLDVSPAGMTIDQTDGVLIWTPTTGQLGAHPVTLRVRDTRGAEATQSFVITVLDSAGNEAPSITSQPRGQIALGRTWFYQVEASDPDNDPLNYAFDQAPTGMVVNASGLVEWTPAPEQFGTNAVVIRVTDGRGGFATQSFLAIVVTLPENRPPQITSSPALVTVVGRDYAYNARATDADGDPLFWSLRTAPAGMSLDAQLGLVRWQPLAEQIGDHEVILDVFDAQGAAASQAFTIQVNALNTPPEIVSVPPTIAAAGSNYFYLVQASDPENDPLTFVLTNTPVGMAINPTNGLITWTPTRAQLGEHQVVVTVADDFGGTASQEYTLTVVDTAPNDPPQFTSQPRFLAHVGTNYTYDANATDPDGDTVTFSLPVAPAAMSIVGGSGLVQWTPTAGQVGAHPVRVLASDGQGNGAYQQFTVTVVSDNRTPLITSAPAGPASVGLPYAYDVLASDPDGDPLTYALTQAPTGMTIDALGRLRWTPQLGDAGSAAVAITVSDPLGATRTQTYNLPVILDSEAPRVLISLSQNPVDPGVPVTATISASDDVRVTSLEARIDGVPLALDGAGQATIVRTNLGQYVLTATARDAVGNTGSATYTLVVIDTANSSAPHVFIHTPIPEQNITNFTDVIATITDDNLTAWRLLIAPLHEGEFRVIASGSGNVTNGTIGTYDPTVLENGVYRLRLEGENLTGLISRDEIQVNVSGNLKLGNYAITFLDLHIPVSGIPITVSRTYDTLRAHVNGALGYGWRLDIAETRLRTTLSGNVQPGDEILPAYRFGTRVFITLPSGRREGFTFEPKLNNRFFPIFDPTFVADAGVDSTLAVDLHDLRYNDITGEFESYIDRLPYNPGAPAFGGVYRLTTKEGLTYRIDGITGDLLSISDRNQNRLTFEEAGIVSSTGERVDFERDPQGRITALIDPAGGRVEYRYDARGNLVASTDRTTNTTTYVYLDNPAHYLTEIRDPLGRMGERSEYGPDGRLIRRINGVSNLVEFAYDPDNSIQSVTDALNQTRTFEYDGRGNIVTEIDPFGRATRNGYDADGRLLASTNALGHVTRYAYDANGNPTSTTDGAGNSRQFTYNALNLVLTETDALGGTKSHTYDSAGNRTATTDALGHTTRFTHNSRGDRTSVTDALGNVTLFQYGSRGRLIGQTDGNGVATTLVNDAKGNPVSETVTVTTPGGPRALTKLMAYDADDRLLSETNAEGEVTRYEYDSFDQITAVVDPRNQRTEAHYNAAGDVTEERDANGSIIARGYDAKGRWATRTDAEGFVTHYVYDANDRLAGIIFPDETPGNLTDNPRRHFEYDAAGRKTAEVDERGSRTEFVYDARNQLILRRDALTNETTFTYDVNGRQLTETDARGRTTRYEYNAAGQLTRTILPDGTWTADGYDALGRIVAKTNQLGHVTRLEYDALNHLVAVVNPLGHRTEDDYDETGNLGLQRDANGRETRIEYDGANRKIAMVRPMGQRQAMAYDGNGNAIAITNADGTVIEREYDALDREVTRRLSGGEQTAFAYTPRNQRSTITDARGTLNFSYDARNRLRARAEPDSRAISYQYDAAGNSAVRSVPSGGATNTFDALNRLASVRDADGGVTTYAYDAVGNLIRTVLPNGVVETREHDALNRLTFIEQTNSAGVLSSYRYLLDAGGRRLRVEEHTGRSVDYAYDDADRLLVETITETNNTVRAIAYAYDAVGNRLSRNDSLEGLTTYTYNLNDQLLTETRGGETITHTYDANGQLIRQQSNSGGGAQFAWNAEGRLVGAETITGSVTNQFSYAYDADGLRVAMTENGVETRFLLDANNTFTSVAEEYEPGGALKVAYVHGHGLISQQRGGTRSYHHGDALNSTRTLTDIAGGVTDRFQYDAYGRLTARSGTTANKYLFAGQQFDSGTDLYYLRSRYLSPRVGRFISPDPFAGVIGRPSSLHRYQYASANPVHITDPSGRFDLVGTIMSSSIMSFIGSAYDKALVKAFVTIRDRAAKLQVFGSIEIVTGLGMIAENHDIGVEVYYRGQDLVELAVKQIRAALAQIGVDVANDLNLLNKALNTVIFFIDNPIVSGIYKDAKTAIKLFKNTIGFGDALGEFLGDPSLDNFRRASEKGLKLKQSKIPKGPPFGWNKVN